MSATNRGAVRMTADFYPTPAYSVYSLLEDLTGIRMLTWGEPCKGDGAIIAAMEEYGARFWEWAELAEGRDYLKDGMTGPVDAIITNPPFSLAQEFIDKSLGEASFVAYLLRLNFLGAQKRGPWWQGKEPTHLYVLSKRPSFTGNGTDATEYAWFVWDKRGLCKRPPGIYVI